MLLLYLITTAGITFIVRRPTSGRVEILPPPTITTAPPATPVVLVVYVSGAVTNPGVYELPEDSRIEHAIESAGGFAIDAFRPGINLARSVSDGQQIHIPNEKEAYAPAPIAISSFEESDSSISSSGPININAASVDELTTLPGIGPAIANRIIEFRQSNGRFRSIEEIKKVRGIGDATFANVKDSIVAN